MSSRFSSNSEAFALEFLENLEEMFPRYLQIKFYTSNSAAAKLVKKNTYLDAIIAHKICLYYNATDDDINL